MIFRWWRKWDDQKRLAQKDATVLIARYGTRASHIAIRRAAMMRKRVHSITRQLLPYDGDDGSLEKRPS